MTNRRNDDKNKDPKFNDSKEDLVKLAAIVGWLIVFVMLTLLLGGQF